jgi:cytochrome c oxidase assembly protein subunit 15
MNHLKKSWLLLSILCVIMMIIIGGYTRLTDSGLSIVEWRPITGALPPLSAEAWNTEFVKYQQSPEYQKINMSFSLEDFKNIYYVEYFHRLMGRILALTFLLPFLYFLHKKALTNEEIKSYFLIATLIMFQGFMGWYMVKSGLISNPHVSHLRLAAHLFTACILLHVMTLEYLSLEITDNESLPSPGFHANFIIFNIYLQIFSGALVAGLDAGLVYNSFPLMDGNFIPPEISNIHRIFDIFTSPGSVQFIHRMIAYFLLVNVLFFCYRLVILFKDDKQVIRVAHFLLVLIFLQLALGISTLLLIVPLQLALLHQLCGILLLITSIYASHRIRSSKRV